MADRANIPTPALGGHRTLKVLCHRARTERGFTLIEVLVVTVILGLLAAIVVPSYINQRTKGQDAQAKEGAGSAQTAIETYFTNQDSPTYVGATVANLTNIEPTLANVTLAEPSGLTGSNYTVTVTSVSGTTFSINRTGGTITRTCSSGGSGGCQSGGVW